MRFDLSLSPIALSLSRIAFYCVLLAYMLDLMRNQHAAFRADSLPLVNVLIPMCLISCAMVILGAQTRIFLIINFVCVRLVTALASLVYVYHLECIFESAVFVFLFSPRPTCLALDAKFGKTSASRRDYTAYFVVLFLLVEFIYLDSVYFKLQSVVWLNGSAFWLGATVPQYSLNHFPLWFQTDWALRAVTYAAFLFEALFPLILVQCFRIPVLLPGFALHLGSVWFYPMPCLGLAMSALLIAFIPISEPQCPPIRLPVVSNRGWLRQNWLYVLLSVVLLTSQLTLTFLQSYGTRNLLNFVVGSFRHPLFWDWHFRIAKPILRFTNIHNGKQRHIASFDDLGYSELADRQWHYLAVGVRFSEQWQPMVEQFVRGWLLDHDQTPQVVMVEFRDGTIPVLNVDFSLPEVFRHREWKPAGVMNFAQDGSCTEQWTSEFLSLFNGSRQDR